MSGGIGRPTTLHWRPNRATLENHHPSRQSGRGTGYPTNKRTWTANELPGRPWFESWQGHMPSIGRSASIAVGHPPFKPLYRLQNPTKRVQVQANHERERFAPQWSRVVDRSNQGKGGKGGKGTPPVRVAQSKVKMVLLPRANRLTRRSRPNQVAGFSTTPQLDSSALKLLAHGTVEFEQHSRRVTRSELTSFATGFC